jgi:sporulation protein YlmC with PRC-barrel domain
MSGIEMHVVVVEGNPLGGMPLALCMLRANYAAISLAVCTDRLTPEVHIFGYEEKLMKTHKHPVAKDNERGTYVALAVAVCAALMLSAPFTVNAEPDSDRPAARDSTQDSTRDDKHPASVGRADMPPGIEKASELIGRDVYDAHGESIGEIKDLALDPGQQRVNYTVVSFGGVMGVGSELNAVPLTSLDMRGKDNLILNMSEQELKDLQGFDDDNWPGGAVVKAKEYLDYEVKNINGDELGEVKDLAVDLNNGKIRYAVIEHDRLTSISDKLIAVPTSKLAPGSDENELVLKATDAELERMIKFSDHRWPPAADGFLSSRAGQAGASGYR